MTVIVTSAKTVKVVKKVELEKNITINTNLIGKTEVFRMLALSEATGLPLLLEGPPGVAKTACVRDYAKGRGTKKLFMLEVDEYTRPAEIKGRPNISKLVRKDDPVYEVISPIVDADYIIINEIDKASGGLRNGLMSIMNEKVLFNGVEEVPLVYKSFVATCNQIPKDEEKSPLWDRFVLRCKVTRLGNSQIMEYFKRGHKNLTSQVQLSVPTSEFLKEGIVLSELKMSKLVDACYKDCSDRTLSYLPLIVKCVAHIWSCSLDNAYVKTCEILVGPTKAKTFSDQIVTKEMKLIQDRIDMLAGISDMKSLKNTIHEISVLVTNFAKDSKLSREQIEEIDELLNNAVAKKGIDINGVRKS